MNKHLTSSNVIATVALVFAVGGGSAYAATSITSAQIKDNTVQGKDIKNSTIQGKDVKNRSLTTSDLSSGTVASLKGKTGPAGAAGVKGDTGAPGTPGAKGDKGDKGDAGESGANVFNGGAPAGTKMQGVLVATDHAVAGGETLREAASYPLLLSAAPNVKINPGADAASVTNVREDTTNCGGTAAAPEVATGYSCFYVTDATNFAANSIGSNNGADTLSEPFGDRAGFYVIGTSAAAGATSLRGVWAVNPG